MSKIHSSPARKFGPIILWVSFVLAVVPFPLSAQPSPGNLAQSSQEKIELIMRIQDSRTIHNDQLISLLTDPDPSVRERAVRAFGSIQDTSVMSLLVDRLTVDGPAVQFAAAFAIGQTAGQLSRGSKESLEHDLIWSRFDRVGHDDPDAAGRLIEEIGKFGSAQALADLLQRFGNAYPPVHKQALMMSIARFGIRSVTSREAIQYLLKFIKPPESAPWQAVYALQRIGDHQEIRNSLEDIVKLYKHDDPMVRMNLATLLGKTKDERTSLIPLQKLADFDGDWRVRVNAFKALSNFQLQGKDDLIRTFRRGFYDSNPYVVLTALSAFGNSGLKPDSAGAAKEAIGVLEKMTLNKDEESLWQFQAEAATSLAKLRGSSALPFIKLAHGRDILQAQILTAAGITGVPEASEILFAYIKNDAPILQRAALDGLQELIRKNPSDAALIDRTYEATLDALNSSDVAVVTTAASMLGDSILHRPASVKPLLGKLEVLRVPDDVEAMQEIASTLGKLKDPRAVNGLRSQLERPDRSVAQAAAAALKSITGNDYSGEIVKYSEPLLTDYDFVYLRSLAANVRVKVETSRGDFVMELYKNVAPFTVMSFLKLATEKAFFRGRSFHRVVPNFVVQGGDPRGDGWGGPGYSIRSEFSPLSYETGTVGMASAGKDTEGSQFFITQSPQPHLDGRYTIFGKVVSGMNVVDKILVDDHIFDVKIIK